MNELDKSFIDYCKEVNEAFDNMGMLVSLKKQDSPELNELLKDIENGNG